MIVLTRDQVRRVDRLAIDELGIPGVVLMENAGRGVAEQALEMLNDPGTAKHTELPRAGAVVILCGGGNNGGDGYVAARQLHNAGVPVTLLAAKDPAGLTGDAAVHCEVCKRMGLGPDAITNPDQLENQAASWPRAALIIDALLGTGFTGEVRGHLAEVIDRCNAARAADGGPRVLAVDVPSGLDCDTGRPFNAVVHADTTVTFVTHKQGFTADTAQRYLGRVVVAGIGTPPSLIDRVIEGRADEG